MLYMDIQLVKPQYFIMGEVNEVTSETETVRPGDYQSSWSDGPVAKGKVNAETPSVRVDCTLRSTRSADRCLPRENVTLRCIIAVIFSKRSTGPINYRKTFELMHYYYSTVRRTAARKRPTQIQQITTAIRREQSLI